MYMANKINCLVALAVLQAQVHIHSCDVIKLVVLCLIG